MSRSFAWFVVGQFSFGLLIGVMVGLSYSPIVGSLISLLFAFVGGSLLVLLKGRTEQEIAIIGVSITFLSIAIIIGATAGIYLRVGPPDIYQAPVSGLRGIDQSLSVDEINRLGGKKEYVDILCTLIQSTLNSKDEIKKEDIVSMIDKKVDPKIIHALLDADYDCQDEAARPDTAVAAAQGKKANTSGFGLYSDKVRKELFGLQNPQPETSATK